MIPEPVTLPPRPDYRDREEERKLIDEVTGRQPGMPLADEADPPIWQH